MKYDKQFHVLSAIYRMARVNKWPIEPVIRLLTERAKHKPDMARKIAELWFRGSFKHHPRTTETFSLGGNTYQIERNPNHNNPNVPQPQDKYRYTLPSSNSYTHPTRDGAKHMCQKHANGDHVDPLKEMTR